MSLTRISKSEAKSIFVVASILLGLGLLGANLYFTINPTYLAGLDRQQQIINELEELTTVNVFEQPRYTVIRDVDTIREQSAINAEVYEEAENGDYVVAFSDKLIIYRRDEGEIIYEGPSPSELLETRTNDLLVTIQNDAEAAGLIQPDGEGNLTRPQLSVITDVEATRASNPGFYQNVLAGDVVAVFVRDGVVVLYRPNSGEIVNQGSYSTSIQ